MAWLHRLGNTLWSRTSNHDLIAEEMEFHLEERTREGIARGMSPGAARAEALRRFGNPALLREKTMAADRLAWLDALSRDLRLAVRSLARRRGLALTAIASLALGIGANSAIFSVIDAVLLRPLPLPHPERLVTIAESKNGEESGSNPARLADWGSQVEGIAAAGGFYGEGLVLTGHGDPIRLRTVRTLGRPLAVLGIRPILGRGFTAAEEAGFGERVVLVGEGLWRRQLGGLAGDAGVIGRSLTLSGEPFTILGVVPDRLGYPEDFDLLIPAPRDVQQASRNAGFLKVVARLRPGVTLAGLQAQLMTVAGRLAQQYPDSDAGRSARAIPLQEDQTGGSRLPLLVLLGTVALVLAITCVNIASLLLARAAERQREAAIRVALGAGRGGLMRLYLAESLVLALAGGALGLVLASASLATLKSLLPEDTPRLASAQLDLRVAVFGFALALLCGLGFGLAPALYAARSRPSGALREGGRAGASAGSLRARRLLIGAQVALSVVVLVGVGLLGRSLLLLQSAPLGVRSDHVLTMKVDFPWDTDKAKLDRFQADTLEAIAAIPGVRAVGVADRLPLEGGSQSGPVAVDGLVLPPDLVERAVSHRAASPGFFAAMGIPLAAGRLVRERADANGPREVVVNQTLAHLYFPDGRALGRRLTFDVKPGADKPGKPPRWFEIVGIVGDVRMTAAQTAQMPEVFVLPRDTYWPLARFVVRTAGEPRSATAAVRAAVRRIEPNLVIGGIATMNEEAGQAAAEPRTRVRLLGAFAVLALWLAALGLYGVLASDVTRRTHEIGLRLALGADRRRVLAAVLRQGTTVALGGLLLGLVAAVVLGRWLGALLFGVQPFDPPVLLGVSLIILSVAAASSWLPARRAAGVDPAVALRHE